MTFKDTFKLGDYYQICDRSGFKVRASETKKEWNGRIVREEDFERRHPQDFARGRRDDQRVPFSSPEEEDRFLAANEVTKDSL